MRRKLVLFVVASLLLLPVQLLAQKEKKESILERLEKGDKAYNRGNYLEAIELYEAVATETEDDPDIKKRIGVTQFKLDHYSEALPILNSVRTASDTIDIYVEYYLAVCLHKLGRYNEAIQQYRSCLQYIDLNSIDSGQDEIKKRIAQCEFWKKLSGSKLDVTITRLDSTINTKAPEYGARILGDSLMLFTSQRTGNFPMTELLIKPDEDIYVSRRSMQGDWLPATKSANTVNSTLNNAVAGISSDGTNVYLYNDVHSGDILVSKFNGKFSRPDTVRGQLNTEEFTESSLALANSGNVCYFVSNRTDPGNIGGKDIFIATKNQDGSWGDVKNAGTPINSKYDEDFVFWCDDDTSLYFSSNREESVGGFDIFRCKLSNRGTLLPPVNIGLPINTPYNDIAYFRAGNKAWYSTIYKDYQQDIFEINYSDYQHDSLWYLLTIEGIRPIEAFECIDPVYFQSGSSRIMPGNSSFNHLAKVLSGTKGSKVRLSGHSDWTGDQETNDRLSFERAVNLATQLVASGVDPKMLSLDFYGEDQKPPDDLIVTDTLAQRIKACHRSVEISIEKQGYPYLYVKNTKPFDTNKVNNDSIHTFAIMVYMADKSYKPYRDKEGIIESYSPQDRLYYYHSKYYTDIRQAQQELEKLTPGNEKAFLFLRK